MTHPEVTVSSVKPEIVTTDRILTATAGVRTELFRLPYRWRRSVPAYRGEADTWKTQRLGYLVSLHDFDPNDWKYGDCRLRPATPVPLPPTTMNNITILLHDGGGNRAETLSLPQTPDPLGPDSTGTPSHSLPQVSGEVRARALVQARDLWDRESLWWYQLSVVVPNALLRLLFWFAMISVVGRGMVNVVLAAGRAIRNNASSGSQASRNRRENVEGPADQRAPPSPSSCRPSTRRRLSPNV